MQVFIEAPGQQALHVFIEAPGQQALQVFIEAPGQQALRLAPLVIASEARQSRKKQRAIICEGQKLDRNTAFSRRLRAHAAEWTRLFRLFVNLRDDWC